MRHWIGIDIGSDSIKAAWLAGDKLLTFGPIKTVGRPLEKIHALINEFRSLLDGAGDPAPEITLGLTGPGAEAIGAILGLEVVLEPDALAAGMERFHPDVGHLIEIGAESQKFISLYRDRASGRLLIDDVIPGGKCAGGTGSFLDYMHRRLKYDSLREFAQAALSVEVPAGISGRCAVFAESDIVHHYQKGTPKEKIVAGIHQAVARGFKALIRNGRIPEGRIAFIGGVALNQAVALHLVRELGLKDDQLFVPDFPMHLGAVGAALRGSQPLDPDEALAALDRQMEVPFDYQGVERIRLQDSILMQPPADQVPAGSIPLAALGVDIGSVSTKAALITRVDGEYRVLASHYRRTEGNPVEAVKRTLEAIRDQAGERGYNLHTIVAATTGSGRYLTGHFIGADLIRDEISAQASGVSSYMPRGEITVIELGGQDSKFLQLSDGVVTDFEMNWACAAGTGALIEKHAANLDLPVESFGDHALAGGKPPLINSTCAVFSESALLHFQQNNVSRDNLCAGACLASAKNYLIKVVRQRPISRQVVFQGAVAFNKGMVAAFESLLGRPIIVPPYPHLTGAIGAARLAYEAQIDSSPASSFRGFNRILESTYDLSSFQCNHCANECLVNRFVVGRNRFYQGDRCDRYSAVHKSSKGDHLPDLFKEREELLLSISDRPQQEDAPLVGIPRGMLFSEYFPLWNSFFSALGFRVKASPPTSKRIVARGMEKVMAEPCFPVKVAHGHPAYLLEEERVDFLFMPAIMTAEAPHGRFEHCATCPYIQSAPDVIRTALELDADDPRLLTPTIFFDRGEGHLRRVCREMTAGMRRAWERRPTMKERAGLYPRSTGEPALRFPSFSRLDVDRALARALEVHNRFRERIQERGREIMESLSPEQTAFVVVGRPYGVHDAALNMDLAKKIRDEGYLAIPIDYLPLASEDPSDSWPNIYPFQGQRKLAAARYIAGRPNLHAVVVTYFACGPDAFLDQMFKEELATQYLTIQMDEHTSDTGILTRIQAHLSTARAADDRGRERRIRTAETRLALLGDKILWVPYLSEGARVLTAVIQGHGVDARVLPRSPDAGLSRARQEIPGDVCTPMLHTTEDMLFRAEQPDFNPGREAFFQGKSGGPCRFGLYYMLQKFVLDSRHGNVDLVTLGNRDISSGLGTFFTLSAYDALLAYDMLEKMCHHVRPDEVTIGETDAVFQYWIEQLCRLVSDPDNRVDTSYRQLQVLLSRHLHTHIDLVEKARKAFAAIPRRGEKRPLVGVVGEFYVRLSEPANQSIVRRIETLGGEAWLAPMTEFFGYSNYITGVHAYDRWNDERDARYLVDSFLRRFLDGVAARHEHILFEATGGMLEHLDEIRPAEVVALGSGYVNRLFGGEAILSMGKSEDFARRRLDGIVSVGPFNCMPSMVVKALSRELRRRHENIPFFNVEYDGYADSSREQRLAMFMSQVHERFRLRKDAAGQKEGRAHGISHPASG